MPKVETPGSSVLTPEQAAEMEARYGKRYTTVADGSRNPWRGLPPLRTTVKGRK